MGISLIERDCGKVAVPLKMKGLVEMPDVANSFQAEMAGGGDAIGFATAGQWAWAHLPAIALRGCRPAHGSVFRPPLAICVPCATGET